jgi:hypothetical protein
MGKSSKINGGILMDTELILASLLIGFVGLTWILTIAILQGDTPKM